MLALPDSCATKWLASRGMSSRRSRSGAVLPVHLPPPLPALEPSAGGGVGENGPALSRADGELAVFARSAQHITRPVISHDDGSTFHDHKGFNWMALRDWLSQRFTIERVVASPVPWLGPHLATQVWFVARKKERR